MPENPAPEISVTRGQPDPGEIAAVVAVLLAAKAGQSQASHRRGKSVPDSGWSDRARLMRAAPRPGPHGWRASAWSR